MRTASAINYAVQELRSCSLDEIAEMILDLREEVDTLTTALAEAQAEDA